MTAPADDAPDIVDVLRREAAEAESLGFTVRFIHDAADEIERLRRAPGFAAGRIAGLEEAASEIQQFSTASAHAIRVLIAAAPSVQEGTRAAADVLAERRRQIEVEGWTPEHDDTHGAGEMANAAAYYALTADKHGSLWPWDWKWCKRTTRRRDLVKAGALIVAEIERLDRAAPPASATPDGEE